MNIVTRAEWGADPLACPANLITTPTPEVWAHHVGGNAPGAAGMRALQAAAIGGKLPGGDYIDIPYNWKIDQDGTIYEARGAHRYSAATANHNSMSHAIVFDGNFQTDEPSSAMCESAAWLLAEGFRRRWWTRPEFTGGHRDASGNEGDTCPGNHLEAQLSNINKRAHALLVVSSPKVKPMYDPPFPAVATAACPPGGAWMVAKHGTVKTIGKAPYRSDAHADGAADKHGGAARIEPHRYRVGLLWRWGYRITFADGTAKNYQ